MIFDKLNVYVLKEFIKMFLCMIFGTMIFIFFIDFLEFYGKIEKYNINILDAIKIVFYRVPTIIETALYFIILLSSVFTLTKLSLTSELVAINTNKKSLLDLVIIKSIFIFTFGIIYVFYVNPLITNLSKKSIKLENIYTKKNDINFLSVKDGIWFKQNNTENDINIGEVIFKAEKFYPNEIKFENVSIMFLGNNNLFQKRINCEYMTYKENNFYLKNNQILKGKYNLEYKDEIILPTKLTEKFLKQHIQNHYEDTSTLSFFELYKLIKEFKVSNLDIDRFVIKQYTLILIPFMYVIMIMISYVFLNINSRKQDYILNIFKTILCGFVIFMVQNISNKLGTSNILNPFLSTFIPFVVMLLVTTTLMIKKIKLCNF